jgi:Domain of unknown function (DUF305)
MGVHEILAAPRKRDGGFPVTQSCMVALLIGVTLGGAAAAAPTADDFYGLMDDIMERMHAGMHVAPSADIDRDFTRMMIPHHQGAIDMAILELRFGKDERLRRLAQAIIIEQGQEITFMRSVFGDVPTPMPPANSTSHDHPIK